MRKRTFFDDYTGRNFNKATNIRAKGPEDLVNSMFKMLKDHVKTQRAGPSFWFLWLVNTSKQYGTKYKPPNTPVMYQIFCRYKTLKNFHFAYPVALARAPSLQS